MAQNKKGIIQALKESGMCSFVLETVKGYAFDFLSEMAAAARQQDMTVCLENMLPRYQ